MLNSRVLYDAISRPNGLRVSKGKIYKMSKLNCKSTPIKKTLIKYSFKYVACYYVRDVRYIYGQGFLAPYRGTRHHLFKWKDGYTPTNYKKYLNIKHAFA